jgi:hypothetical protein
MIAHIFFIKNSLTFPGLIAVPQGTAVLMNCTKYVPGMFQDVKELLIKC